MFRLLNNKKAQNTAEYALLIALVVAGIIAMQQYAQRALQARVRDASTYMASSTNTIGTSVQYEPYYTQSNYDVTRDSEESKRLGQGLVGQDATTNRTRDGGQRTVYDPAAAPTAVETNTVMPTGI